MLKNFLFLCAFLMVGACGPIEDGGNDDAAVEVDRSVYPEGPYGSDEGSIVTNHKLLTADGEDFFLGANVRENADNKLMLLSSGAPWCTACIEEQPKLQALYETFHSQGLEYFKTSTETPPRQRMPANGWMSSIARFPCWPMGNLNLTNTRTRLWPP